MDSVTRLGGYQRMVAVDHKRAGLWLHSLARQLHIHYRARGRSHGASVEEARREGHDAQVRPWRVVPYQLTMIIGI